MPDLASCGGSFRRSRGDDVVRGHPRGLVHEQHAVLDGAGGAQSCSASSARRNATSSGNSRSVEKPAARRCPPPPWARAMRETSTRSSVARRETLRRVAAPSESRSRTRPATAVPWTARRWSTTPSENDSVRAGDRVVLAREVGDREQAAVVALDGAQAARQQLELAVRDALVQAPVDRVHVDARADQLGGHDVRVRAGVLVHEAARVGDQADVERLGDRLRELHAEALHQVPDDLGGAGRVRHHVVHGAEARVVVVVVDVEDPRGVLELRRPGCGRRCRSRGRSPCAPRRRPAPRSRASAARGSGTRRAAGSSSAHMNETASLPIASSTCCIAASEPSASPSGCSCVVSTNFSSSRSTSSTSSRDDLTPLRVLTARPASSSISCAIRMPRSDVSS